MSEADTYLSLWKGDIPRALRTDPRPTGGLRGIQRRVEAKNGLWADELLTDTREHRISHPRQEFMWLARQVKWPDGAWRYSLPQIADYLGLKDHTTVLHGVRAHAERNGLKP